ELIAAGITSFKIEGRAKSAYYAAITTAAYRHAIDAAIQKEPLAPIWRDEVEKVSHRHYGTGFFYGEPGQYTEHSRYVREFQVCAIVTDCEPDGSATLSHRNKFFVGEELELVAPNLAALAFTVTSMTDANGVDLSEARHPEMVLHMKLPCAVPPLAILRKALLPKSGN
ncbi:MAG: U32 family peptidase C-terminal domain-containing protein, partial [Evtepia sp.]